MKVLAEKNLNEAFERMYHTNYSTRLRQQKEKQEEEAGKKQTDKSEGESPVIGLDWDADF